MVHGGMACGGTRLNCEGRRVLAEVRRELGAQVAAAAGDDDLLPPRQTRHEQRGLGAAVAVAGAAGGGESKRRSRSSGLVARSPALRADSTPIAMQVQQYDAEAGSHQRRRGRAGDERRATTHQTLAKVRFN